MNRPLRLAPLLVAPLFALPASPAAAEPRDEAPSDLPRVEAPEPSRACPRPRRDTDGDGASDRHERREGTDPDRNGLLSFPEPMVYDLVRGLDSERGELELNVLGVLRHAPGGARFAYAPEVEWAFADGHAIELELPFDGPHLEAVKVALQGTLGVFGGGRRAHGWQALGELSPDGGHGRVALKWLGNLRLSTRDAVVSLFGARADVAQGHLAWQALANVNLFHAVSQQVTLGIELNLAASRRETEWLLMPQVHVQLNHHFRLQWGLGATGVGDTPYVTGAFRGVVEL